MSSLFDEIVQRAEKLNSDVRLGSISEFRLQTTSSSLSAEVRSPSCAPSLLDAGLDDIFRRSEEIWSRKQSLRPVATGMGASLKTSKDLGQLSVTRLFAPAVTEEQQTFGQKSGKIPTDYEGDAEMSEGYFPDTDVDKYIQRTFNRAEAERVEAERTFLNQQILERSQTSNSTLISSAGKSLDKSISGGGIKHFKILPNAPLAHEQKVFAQKVDAALSIDANVLLIPALKEAVKKLNMKDSDYIWHKVFTVLPKASFLRSDETVREMRSSKRWLDYIIEVGTQYLQFELMNHMEAIIEANLVKARRGGIPGNLSLIAAYLNVKPPSLQKQEDGLYGSHPKWVVLFYCIRLGDAHAASEVAKGLFNIAQCSTLVGILANLHKFNNIDEEKRTKLRAEWKQNKQACEDPHKRAVYGLFLGFDCSDVNTTIEDWLWAKLFSCKYSIDPPRALRQLQTTICAQHGEKYFVSDGGSHLLYFSVLLLTGQLERAILVLFKSEHCVHSVHIGIIAHQLRLLMPTSKVSDELLTTDVHEASICKINLARLVLLYVKDFELSNIEYAINYCFFLRDFQLDAVPESKVSRSVFEACVSRIVYMSGERDAILGQLNMRGERVPGLIDKFASALSVTDVIARVAFDTNVQGDPLGACHLYALANNPENAMKLASCQLSLCIAKPKSEETRKAVECARWLAHRYDRPNMAMENQSLATLLLLLELHTFFLLASEERHHQAVELVQSALKFVPMDPDEVQSSVAQFHLVPDEIRPLLPDFCSRLMQSIVALHDAEPPGSPAVFMLKQFSKALILYTAMLPYRFPVSTNSLLLQLQSKIV